MKRLDILYGLEQKQGWSDVSSVSDVGILLMKMPAEIGGSPYSNPSSALGVAASIASTARRSASLSTPMVS